MEYMQKKLTLKEALDYLEAICESDDEEDVRALYIEPPDNDGNIRGEDDGEEEGSGSPDDVCAAQLKTMCEIVVGTRSSLSDENINNVTEILTDVLDNSDLNLSISCLDTTQNTQTSSSRLKTEIYQGKNPRSNKRYEDKFGKCTAPLINMIDDFDENVQKLPFSFYFDNLFTGFPLLTYLKLRGYEGTGTIRENRLPKNTPIEGKKTLKKQKRGFCESFETQETNISLTKWVDNAVVCVASTCFGLNPVSKALRYSKEEGKKVTVIRPCAVTEYNKYMCGVDRFDQNVSLYRIAYRGKKWWSCIFTWLIDACVQNAWQLHRHVHSEMNQLEFRRQIAVRYCKQFGMPPRVSVPPVNKKRRINNNTIENVIRYDQTNHFIVPIEKKRRCAGDLCKSIGRTACNKCNIGLCVKCFSEYHTK